ncbi:contact-dependent growth inhibition system immunity protein [Mucilaginibacter ginsenosidivorax]|uniref:Uncharacterized protein n=1 Tax=Mucilaginibacter ginsenosidivorax TaxID=862126 RepID=A0A5B8W6C1_9SPHI|nr:contact-dependent growth inhibition system immunity protein [Mucilaginibacter ginsenosidivorax]QEC77788.1 hypothetical protein FSB76_18255 [Mucilaginibacter ginsenosidivorax]
MKLENNWRYKSLQNLEKIALEDPATAPTRLVRRCLELLKVPLNEFNTENLRLMIGQEFSLPYLVPLAIEKLTEDLFAEGDYYPGDLLAVVLKIKTAFWEDNQQLFNAVTSLINSRYDEIEDAGISLGSFAT